MLLFKNTMSIVATIILASSCSAPLYAQTADFDFIEWNSTAGTTVVAKFVAESNGGRDVMLEREDGKRISVPLGKLTDDSLKLAKASIAKYREAKKFVGKWYWRCPAKGQTEWRITTTLVRDGKYYRLTEKSAGHSQVKDFEESYAFKKKGGVFWPVDTENQGEKRLPFTIDSNGDRITYHRKIEIDGRVLSPGGDFCDIAYAKQDASEVWSRKAESFPKLSDQQRGVSK